MLINVFGNWINPSNVTYIHKEHASCYIGFNSDINDFLTIHDKTDDEVANEINRLTKENK